jgi:uncharacterized protein (DUF736 family)
MAYETKDGQGALFMNDKQNDKQPDRRGYIIWKGERIELAGWIKVSAKSEKYLSLKAQEPREQNQGGGQREEAADVSKDDDIPW